MWITFFEYPPLIIKLFIFFTIKPFWQGKYFYLNFLAFLVVLQPYGRKISKALGGSHEAGKSG